MRRAGAAMAAALGGCIPSVEAPPRYDTPTPLPRETRAPQDGAVAVAAPPAPPPAWAARPVTPDVRTIPASIYPVRPGETLRIVAERTGASADAIARANGLTPPFAIRAGQRLAIPGGRYHLVRGGETGIAIARAYGVDWGRIVAANALAEPYILRVGQRVVIPGDATRPPSAAERAAAFRLDIDDIITGSQPTFAANQRPARPLATPARPIASVAQIETPRGAPGRFVWPVASGPIVRRFGPGGSGERNNGIKIAVPVGTPILAAADGVVAYAGTEVAAFGGLVMLSHGGGLTSVYGHASRLLVTRGQSVKRGDRIALSGSSGFAERPQLHFEIRQGRTPVDPMTRLPAR